MTYSKFIAGTPKAQPRPKAARRGKNIIIYNPDTADTWKALIKHQTAESPRYSDAVKITLTFYLERPKSHYRTGKFSHILKGTAPEHHTQKPDIDNLEKAVLDALVVGGTLKDDSIVVEFPTKKKWSELGDGSGCYVKIEPA
jgi:Holliday junction resolvase RusA-like endonuclease